MSANGQINLNRTIPLFLHGDAGRTLKKQPLEVISFRPIIGIGTNDPALTCKCDQAMTYCGVCKSDPMAQRLNNCNNSYLTHFLTVAFPSKKFKSTPGLLQSILEAVSKDLRRACLDGISINGSLKYHVAILGMSGDMEYHAKTGVLNRSYQNVGHKNFIPCCHECGAGAPHLPFEDVSSNPAWIASLHMSPPWDEAPPFKHIPFEDWESGAAGRFFKRDPFHIFRLGIARNFIGSTIVLFCLQSVFDDPAGNDSVALPERLTRAWSSFTLWCDTHHVSPSGIRGFTKEKLHMPKLGTFPWCGGKGSDSILLLRWLRFLSGLQLIANPTSSIFPLVIKATDGGLAFQAIHRHGVWLKGSCKVVIMNAAKQFVQSYAWLADYCLRNSLQLYAMVPKLHAMDHFAVQLKSSCEPYVCNPAVWDCSMSEDFIGHVSRQSRRISHIQVVENLLLSYKVRTKLIIKRFKKTKLR